jgi:NAD(P)-dependent dehydrogenase (short-subunit alcohol dehydrogenase family)
VRGSGASGTPHRRRTRRRCEKDVPDASNRVGNELGVSDILVNSAGIDMSGVLVADMKLEQWETLLRTDLHPFRVLAYSH